MHLLILSLDTVVFVDGGIYHYTSLCGDGWNSMCEQKRQKQQQNTFTSHSSGDHVSLKNGGANAQFSFLKTDLLTSKYQHPVNLCIRVDDDSHHQLYFTNILSFLPPPISVLAWHYKALRVGFIEMQVISIFWCCGRKFSLFRLLPLRKIAVSEV